MFLKNVYTEAWVGLIAVLQGGGIMDNHILNAFPSKGIYIHQNFLPPPPLFLNNILEL